MKFYIEVSIIYLAAIIFTIPIFGQESKSKVFSPDNSLISKSIVQKRNINEYFDGGAFRCGFSGSENECNYEEVRKVVWQCSKEKTRCYLTISSSSADAGITEHIFIEPNKNNKWLIVRRTEKHRTLSQIKKSVNDLPKVYFIEWQMKDREQILIFKNQLGKVIEKF
jgi:hypothetical protein